MTEELKPCHCGKPAEVTANDVGPFCEFHNIMSAHEAGFVTVEDMVQRIVNLNTRAEPDVDMENTYDVENGTTVVQELRLDIENLEYDTEGLLKENKRGQQALELLPACLEMLERFDELEPTTGLAGKVKALLEQVDRG